MFLLFFLLGVHRQDRTGQVAFGFASALGGFFLLMKLTIGPGALLSLALGCLFQRKKSAIMTRLLVSMACAGLGLLVGWMWHYGSISGLGRYLLVGGSMVRGYSSPRASPTEGWQSAVGAFLAFFVSSLRGPSW